MVLNKIRVPVTIQEDFTKNCSEWKKGKYVICRGTLTDTYYIGHETGQVSEMLQNDKEETVTICKAFAIEVKKGATRSDIINAAEMIAYGLKDAMEVASFNASLSRKYRENSKDKECKEHDEFIEWVKEELKEIL
ncbi:MAG: hypothetical protein IJ180_09660 [Bacteroidales bacterium]|nr:hypothetical protein [Bacteroidales bacterium]